MHPPGGWGVLGEELLGDTGKVQPPTVSQLEAPTPQTPDLTPGLPAALERAGLGGSAQADLRGLSEQRPGNLRPVTNGPLAPPVPNLAGSAGTRVPPGRGPDRAGLAVA